jgi:transglutaminase-like putative cysteine protease
MFVKNSPVTFQGGEPVRTIPTGLFPSRRILNVMKEMIWEASKNIEVRRLSEQLVAGLRCDYDKVLNIWEFVTDNTDYQKDPQGFELIKTPLIPIDEWNKGITPQLDCDDLTVLSLSMLASVGVPVALRAASYRPDGKLTHVYGLAWIAKDKIWLPVDCVAKNGGPGWEKTPYTNKLDWRVS